MRPFTRKVWAGFLWKPQGMVQYPELESGLPSWGLEKEDSSLQEGGGATRAWRRRRRLSWEGWTLSWEAKAAHRIPSRKPPSAGLPVGEPESRGRSVQGTERWGRVSTGPGEAQEHRLPLQLGSLLMRTLKEGYSPAALHSCFSKVLYRGKKRIDGQEGAHWVPSTHRALLIPPLDILTLSASLHLTFPLQSQCWHLPPGS